MRPLFYLTTQFPRCFGRLPVVGAYTPYCHVERDSHLLYTPSEVYGLVALRVDRLHFR